MSRLAAAGRRVPAKVWRAALGQFVLLAAVLVFRWVLLKLPLPVLYWLTGLYRFDWVGRTIYCDTNRCLFTYWGRSMIAPRTAGWYLVQAVHRDTLRAHYALGYSCSRFMLRIGYKIKPTMGHLRLADSMRGCWFKINR